VQHCGEREERESKLKERFLFMLIFDWITNDAMQAKVVKVGSSGGGAANKRWSTRAIANITCPRSPPRSRML
jgi:hypothetical protein